MARPVRTIALAAILLLAGGAFAQAPPARRSADLNLEVLAHPARPTRELRLGVVCYGGVSLAIYMNGIVREMQNLVIASRALEAGVPEERLPAGSVRGYHRALRARFEREGVMTRVVVDAIAGTSAGGINGVFLAKALAHDLPLDSLRDLWFEKGDLTVLLGGRWQRFWRPVKLLFTLGRSGPPLEGNAMLGWLHDALRGMSAAEAGRTLMPPDHELNLYVTTTDFYGFPRHLFAGDPPQVIERQYANVLRFSYLRAAGGEVRKPDQFDPGHDPALALAARATSSFPGAFPPVSLAEAAAVLKTSPEWIAATMREQFPQYALDGADADNTWFIDGGVLDNAPFGPVISDLRSRQAGREVERRLIYLQPDPGRPPGQPTGEEPQLVKTVLGAVARIPGYEGIAGDLERVDQANARVARVRDIVRRGYGDVAATLRGSDVATAEEFPQLADVAARREKIDKDLEARVGLQYPSYFLLRVDSVVEQFGAGIGPVCGFPPGGEHQAYVSAAIRHWAAARGFVGADATAEDQKALIDGFDVGYTRRQIRFVVDAVDSLYPELRPGTSPTRAELDAAKVAAFGLSEELLRFLQGRELPADVQARIRDTFCTVRPWQEGTGLGEGARAYAEAHRADFDRIYADLGAAIRGKREDVRARLYEEFRTRTRAWRPEARELLLVHYLGFPAWDAIVYPYVKLGDAGELQRIEVVRISPDDATALGGGSAAEKLDGVKAAHFGAFLKRPYRENDYLWGRLDGAERLLRLAAGETTDVGAPLGRVSRETLMGTFSAILDEEGPALTRVQPLIARLRERIAQP